MAWEDGEGTVTLLQQVRHPAFSSPLPLFSLLLVFFSIYICNIYRLKHRTQVKAHNVVHSVIFLYYFGTYVFLFYFCDLRFFIVAGVRRKCSTCCLLSKLTGSLSFCVSTAQNAQVPNWTKSSFSISTRWPPSVTCTITFNWECW